MTDHDTPVMPMRRPSDASNEAMRQRSGSVNGGPMAAVLYRLLRDGHVSPGTLEQLMDDYCDEEHPVRGRFTNGWLGTYANDVARRLLVAEAKLVEPPEPQTHQDAEYVEKA